MRGYSMPDPATVDSVEGLREGFDWDIPAAYNIAGEVLSTATERPDRTALYHVDSDGVAHEFTYRAVAEASARVAAGIRDRGLQRGDRIAVCLPPSPEALVTHLAAYRLGAIVAPVSLLYGSKTFEHVLTNASPDVTILDTAARDRFEGVFPRIATGSTVVIDSESNRYGTDGDPVGGLAGLTLDTAQRSQVPVADTAPETPAIILHTSGSSGQPKAVVQSHQYLAGTLPGYQLWFELFGDTHAESVWTPSSWAWAGALFDVVFPTLAMGGRLCSRHRRSGFDPGNALDFIERAGVSRAFVPPTALDKIRRGAAVETADLSALEVILGGGEPMAESLKQWVEDAFGVRVNVSYGLTEANALVGNCGALYPHRPESIGVPYPGHRVEVVDEDGNSVSPGEQGELVVEPPDPVLFRGYWRDGELNPRPEGKAFQTEDSAYRDEDGYIYYEGRKDSVIISSGYRVDPKEVEATLAEVPDVDEAVVGSVPDERIGHRIVAYVLPATDRSSPDEKVLIRHVRETLGKYKTPHEVHELESVPQTYSGKVDRESLFTE